MRCIFWMICYVVVLGCSSMVGSSDEEASDSSSADIETASTVDGETDSASDTASEVETETWTETEGTDETDGTESETDTGTSTACLEGASQCKGEMLQHCVDAQWVDYSNCLMLGATCEMVNGNAICFDIDTGSDVDTDTDTDTETDTGSDTMSDSEIDTGSESMIDTGSETMETDSVDTETDSEDAGTDTETETESDTGSDTTPLVMEHDPSTGFDWCGSANVLMTIQEANAYCGNLECGGFDDWQVPTISRLRTLIVGCEYTARNGDCPVRDNIVSTMNNCGGCGEEYPPGPATDGSYHAIGSFDSTYPIWSRWDRNAFWGPSNWAYAVSFREAAVGNKYLQAYTYCMRGGFKSPCVSDATTVRWCGSAIAGCGENCNIDDDFDCGVLDAICYKKVP